MIQVTLGLWLPSILNGNFISYIAIKIYMEDINFETKNNSMLQHCWYFVLNCNQLIILMFGLFMGKHCMLLQCWILNIHLSIWKIFIDFISTSYFNVSHVKLKWLNEKKQGNRAIIQTSEYEWCTLNNRKYLSFLLPAETRNMNLVNSLCFIVVVCNKCSKT